MDRRHLWRLRMLLFFPVVGALAHSSAGSAGAAPRFSSYAACGWRVQQGGLFPGYPSYLSGASADGVSDVWAVGEFAPASSHSTPVGTLVEHWNGAKWTVGPAVNQTLGETHLVGVSALSASDVWAAGYYGDPFSGPIYTLAEHFDGAKWSITPTPNPKADFETYLSGIAALSHADAWAVGEYYPASQSSAQTLAEHWNGSKWTIVRTVNVSSYQNVLAAAAGSASNDVWAVGGAEGVSNGGLAEHWDGHKWTGSSVPSPAGAVLSAVTEIAPNDIWAVGNYLSTSPPGYFTLTVHWDGNAWRAVSSPNVPHRFWNALLGVAAVSSKDVWAVGYWETAQSGGPTGPLVEHWNGKTWSIVRAHNINESAGFGAVAATPSTLFAVGGYAVSSGVNSTLVETTCS